MYRTEFDPARRLLTITVDGFWTIGTVVAFSGKMLALGAMLKMRHGDYAVFNDARTFPVQSADVARALDVLNAKSATISKGPIATVVSTTLAKLQAERVVSGEKNRVFLDADEARAWLDQVWVTTLVA